MIGFVAVGGSFVGGSKSDPFVADEARYFAQCERAHTHTHTHTHARARARAHTRAHMAPLPLALAVVGVALECEQSVPSNFLVRIDISTSDTGLSLSASTTDLQPPHSCPNWQVGPSRRYTIVCCSLRQILFCCCDSDPRCGRGYQSRSAMAEAEFAPIWYAIVYRADSWDDPFY